MRFITAGSVDDGKSTLIGRLLHDSRAILEDQYAALRSASERRGLAAPDLSLVTDGLEAEREQGITIDVAYRYFATPRRKFIIADTPGHEQYTRNMVTGASTADAAVILLDATRGLLAQTRRHLSIAHLLGIRQVLVAVNKMDLAGYREAVYRALRAEFEAYCAPLGLARLELIPVSALAGDMVVERGSAMPWYAGPTLLEALERLPAARHAAAVPLRFPVQLALRADGRCYLGRVAAGSVAAGDEVAVLPGGRRTRVAAVFAHEGEIARAQAGDSVALRLADELDVSRGDMIADAAAPPRPASRIEAKLCWLSAEPPRARGRYLLRHTTRGVHARLASVDARLDVGTLEWRAMPGEAGMNDILRATLEAQQPLFIDPYSASRATGAFILIDEATDHTVAAGMAL